MSDVTDPNAEKHGIVLSERSYDVLKDVDLIGLPAVGTAFGTIGTLYGIDAHTIGLVVGTIGVVIFLIGILLKISNVQYKAKAEVAAVKAAAIVAPVVSVDPVDASKVVVSDDTIPTAAAVSADIAPGTASQ